MNSHTVYRALTKEKTNITEKLNEIFNVPDRDTIMCTLSL